MSFRGPLTRFSLLSPLLILLIILLLAIGATSALAQEEPNRVDVEVSQGSISVPLTLPEGLTYFYVTNSGSTPQNFRVEGPGVQRQFGQAILPGQTKLMVVRLAPGSYQFSNPVSGQGLPIEVSVGGDSLAAGETGIPVTGQEVTGTPGMGDVTGTPGMGDQTGTPGTGDVTGTPGAGDVTGTPGADGEVPVTGLPVSAEHQGFSVAQVAQPGNGDLGIDVALVQVADGFNDPVNVVSANDGTGRLFVVERNGLVRVVQADGTVLDEPFLDLRDMTLDAFLEQGMYDLEFHPDFATNGRFFVHFAELLRNGDGLIVEYTVAADNDNAADPESARILMQIEQPWANHNGGELAFGPDGYLYIGSGDGGWEGDPLRAGQDLSTLLGKVLRIDVDTSAPGRPYGIPEDNPFAAEDTLVQLFNIPESQFAELYPTARPEIWAYGLRNPWKFQFDPDTGDLYLPDVGQNHWEEINFQPAGSPGGENYGWKFLMGTHCFPIDAAECPEVGVLPVAEYSHDYGAAVVGIGVYRGADFPDLDGIYFLGDWGTGIIWGLQQDDDGSWVFDELLDTETRLTGSGVGEDGALYVTTCNCEYDNALPEQNQPGTLWRLVPADEVGEDDITAPVAGGQQPQPTEDVTGTPGAATPGAGTPGVGDQTGTPGAGTPGADDVTGTPSAGTPGAGDTTATPAPGDETPGAQTPGAPTLAPPDGTGTPGAGTPEPGDGTPEAGEGEGGGAVSAEQGQQVYANTCINCHGANGQGQVGPALAGNPAVNAADPAPLIDIVLNGRNQMPAFRDRLDDAQIASVLTFIRSMWGNDAPPVSEEEVEERR